MRLNPGTPLDHVEGRLTPEQADHIERVERLRATEDARVALEVHRTRSAIVDALDSGVPARYLAWKLGLSPGRIYQIRESVAEYEATSGR